jgi:hypothetical protein
MLPPRKKRYRLGIERGPRRDFPVHRAFVKRHACCVPGCKNTDIDPAHVKTRGAGGSDAQIVSLCREHHSEQHDIGIDTFQAKYKIDLVAIAAEFARRTTDRALRESLKEPA